MQQVSRRQLLGWMSASGLALAGAGSAGQAAFADDGDVVAYTGGTLIDGTGAPPRPDTTIVTALGRIVAVGGPRHPVPHGVRVVDVRGKYVLPGLVDMHTHTLDLERICLPLYVANGVTSIREMMGRPFHHTMRRRIEAGELAGPRMVLGSNAIDGPYPFFPGDITSVRTPEEARAAVRQAKAEGADFVKVFSHLNDELLTAIAGEARRLGLPFAGHLPDEVTTERGSELGMRTMEHLWGLVIDVASTRDEIRARIAANPVDPANPVLRWLLVRQLEAEAAKAYDPRRAARLFASLRRRGTVIEPTLHVNRVFYFPPQDIKANEQVKYVPSWLKDDWDAQLGPDWTPEQIAAGREVWNQLLRLVAEVEAAGVTVTAGTDCGLPAYGVPGFSMHDELEKLVAAGLSPIRAIQAGTRDAARTAGIGHVTGTVVPGKSADLLVVDRSPLDDIGNLRRIHAVVNRGTLITREQRERMLADVEAEARITPRPAASAVTGCCRTA